MLRWLAPRLSLRLRLRLRLDLRLSLNYLIDALASFTIGQCAQVLC